MKILVVSSSDCKGGAARIAETLVIGLRNRNHEVTFLVNSRDGAETVSTLVSSLSFHQSRLFKTALGEKVIHRLGINPLGLGNCFPGPSDDIDFRGFDLVHLHDFAGLNLSRLPWLARQLPVVWTIHSMQPLTGNCIYPYDCDRWRKNCGQCPQIHSWPLHYLHRDGSSLNLKLKKRWYRRSGLHAVGVSDWISDQIRESTMKWESIQTIHNAIDTNHFIPANRARVRAELGIPDDHFAIAFSVAANPADTRKGIDLILEAARKLRLRQPITFMPMSIGPAANQLSALVDGSNRMLEPRHLATARELSRYYSAADVIWHPSRADTSSMVSMESMACGTPVIAAAVGGVPEVIGDAGMLIAPESSDRLVNATIRFAEDSSFRESLIAKTRPRVQQLFSLGRFLDDHEATYDRVAS